MEKRVFREEKVEFRFKGRVGDSGRGGWKGILVEGLGCVKVLYLKIWFGIGLLIGWGRREEFVI